MENRFLAMNEADQAQPAAAPAQKNRFLAMNEAEHAYPATVQNLQAIPPTTPPELSLGQMASSAKEHLGPSAMNAIGGMFQAVTHPTNTLGTLTIGVPAAAGLGIGSALAGNSENLDHAEMAQLVVSHPWVGPFIENAYNAGGMYKDKYIGDEHTSTWGKVKNAIATDPVGTAFDATTLLSLGAGATRGVAPKVASGLGKAAAWTNPINWVTKPAAAILNKTGVGPAVASAARTAADVVTPRNILRPTPYGPTQVAQNALMMKAAEDPISVSESLRTAPTLVRGSNPTAMQAATATGQTQFEAMGSQAAHNLPTTEGKINDEQNSARLSAVQTVGKTSTDLNARIAARKAQSVIDYGLSDPVLSTMDDKLLELLNLPHNNEVLGKARDLATQQGRPFLIGDNIPAHTIPASPSGLFDHLGNPIVNPEQHIPAQYAKISGKSLDDIKQSFDKIAFEKASAGIDKREVQSVMNTRNQFLDWVNNEGGNQAYAIGRKNYSDHSNIIDRMKFGQYMESILKSPLTGEDTATLRAELFSKALGNDANPVLGRSSVKNATGSNIGGTYAKDLMTPSEMKRLESVRDDLARNASAEQQAKKASHFKGDINNAGSDMFLPHMLNTPAVPGVLNSLGHFFTNNMDSAIQGNVSKAMMTPKGANALLTEAMNRKAQLQKIEGKTNALARHTAGNLIKYPAAATIVEQRDNKDQRNVLKKR